MENNDLWHTCRCIGLCGRQPTEPQHILPPSPSTQKPWYGSEDPKWGWLAPAFCISLKDSEMRTRRAAQEFCRVGMCRVIMFYRPDRDKSPIPFPGARGCWESHRICASRIFCDPSPRPPLEVFEADFSSSSSPTTSTDKRWGFRSKGDRGTKGTKGTRGARGARGIKNHADNMPWTEKKYGRGPELMHPEDEANPHLIWDMSDQWSDTKHVTIFEDDVLFSDDCQERALSIKTDLEALENGGVPDWRILCLGSLPFGMVPAFHVSPGLWSTRHALGMHAYILSRSACRWLRDRPYDFFDSHGLSPRAIWLGLSWGSPPKRPKWGMAIDAVMLHGPGIYLVVPMIAYQAGSSDPATRVRMTASVRRRTAERNGAICPVSSATAKNRRLASYTGCSITS